MHWKIVLGFGEIRLEAKRALALDDGLLMASEPFQNVAEVIVGGGEIRLEANRARVMRDSLLEAAERRKRNTEIVVRLCQSDLSSIALRMSLASSGRPMPAADDTKMMQATRMIAVETARTAR